MTKHPKKKSYKRVPRDKIKYPSFDIKRAVVNRREELEVDYLDKLNEDEKKFLNQFQEEWVMANFGKVNNPDDKAKLLDKSEKHRKECYNRNNYRNRDILINAKVRGLINRVDSDIHLSYYLDNNPTNYNNTEENLVNYIDKKNKTKKKKS